MFKHHRDFKNSYNYQNTLKNGSLDDIRSLDKLEDKHELRMAQNDQIRQDINRKVEEVKQQEILSITPTRSRGRSL